MASFGGTVLDRMTSEISRLRAMSSLYHIALHQHRVGAGPDSMALANSREYAHRLLLVAREICSSKADPAEEDHHPIILCVAAVAREEALFAGSSSVKA